MFCYAHNGFPHMILIGNDVEFILTRNKTPYSAIGLIGGSKDFPLKVKKGALQEDNVLAEINIMPARTPRAWETNITTVIAQLKDKLPKGISLSTKASARYNANQLCHPKALEFGCDPDYNAWTGEVNRPPSVNTNFRSAGGHVHIGIDNLSQANKLKLIRCMDTIIGLQSVILDKDTDRKKLYGKAGAMRYKPYGVEWRTPSNFWVFSEYTRKWMFLAALFSATNIENTTLLSHVKQEVVNIINNSDTNEAKNYLRHISRAIPSVPIHKNIRI